MFGSKVKAIGKEIVDGLANVSCGANLTPLEIAQRVGDAQQDIAAGPTRSKQLDMRLSTRRGRAAVLAK